MPTPPKAKRELSKTYLKVDVSVVNGYSLQTGGTNSAAPKSAVHVPVTAVTISCHQVGALTSEEMEMFQACKSGTKFIVSLLILCLLFIT